MSDSKPHHHRPDYHGGYQSGDGDDNVDIGSSAEGEPNNHSNPAGPIIPSEG